MARATRRVGVEPLEQRRLFTAYYLDSSVGSNANPGTDAQHPWASIAQLNATTLQPGDSVYFRAGESFAGNLILGAADSGTAAAPVTFDSYTPNPDSSVSYGLQNGLTAALNAANGAGITATDAAGISINDLNIVGAGQAANSYSGVQFDNNLAGNVQLSTVDLYNLTVSGFGKYGITIGGSNGKSGFAGISVSHCSVHDNIVGGIETHGVFSSTATTYANSNLYLGYDTVFDNPGYAKSSNHVGDGIVVSDVTGGTIEHCVAYGNGTKNTHVGGPVGIWAWDANAVVIQSNVSHDNHTASTADGGGFDLDGGDTNCILQYNYSYNNDGAGYGLFEFSGARAWNNNTVRFNISENDARRNSYGAITLWNGGSGINNAQIYDNTIYLTPTPGFTPRGIYVENAVNNVGIRDNIIQTTGGALLIDIEAKQSSLLVQGNDYWSTGGAFQIKQFAKTYKSLAAWQSATGQEELNGSPVGLSVDPRFASPTLVGTETASAYVLAPSSPLIGTGLNLSARFGIAPGPQDFFGDSTSGGWNIGAD